MRECYVSVFGLSDKQVQQAARMMAEVADRSRRTEIGELATDKDHHYLMIDSRGPADVVFVGNYQDLSALGSVDELSLDELDALCNNSQSSFLGCYADVSDWTDQEVQQAAEIFRNSISCTRKSFIGSLLRSDEDHYLLVTELSSKTCVVHTASKDLLDLSKQKQVSKEQVFNTVNTEKEGKNSMSVTIDNLLEISRVHNLDLSICAGEYLIVDMDDRDCRAIRAETKSEWLELIDCVIKLKSKIKH